MNGPGLSSPQAFIVPIGIAPLPQSVVCALAVLAALGSFSNGSQGQERGPISVDLSTAGSEGTPAQFTFARTGEGENGRRALVGDPTAANGRALAQGEHRPHRLSVSACANLKVTANQWHTLALKAEGDRFTVSFDGKALFSTQDRTFPDAGRVALWTKADSVTYFDTISITPLK